MSEKLIDIKNLHAGYDRKVVLKDVSLSIYKNDFLGIIGPNGGGKTTLIKVILGLLKPFSGTVDYKKNIKEQIGYMPQINTIDKKFPILVREVIESGLMSENGLKKAEKEERTVRILKEIGMEDLADRPIGELSGGQWQRTLLGRAIISEPELLILDEPNSYIDKRFESHFYQLLQEINKNTAIVLISHDIGTLVSMVRNVACVNETLHYHPGGDINGEWLEKHFACPLEVVGHGDIPHRILKRH
ncbi:ABC transporter ATP-binding protein [Bacteroidales bacterium OttesenSCG-928-A17]|nr:ABC transporter ATP-binding protein [Bacteroidales bacterium OttesenSCG-928-A17]